MCCLWRGVCGKSPVQFSAPRVSMRLGALTRSPRLQPPPQVRRPNQNRSTLQIVNNCTRAHHRSIDRLSSLPLRPTTITSSPTLVSHAARTAAPASPPPKSRGQPILSPRITFSQIARVAALPHSERGGEAGFGEQGRAQWALGLGLVFGSPLSLTDHRLRTRNTQQQRPHSQHSPRLNCEARLPHGFPRHVPIVTRVLHPPLLAPRSREETKSREPQASTRL